MESNINDCDLKKFFKRQASNLVMFGYVQGQRQALPSLKLTTAIESYINHFGIDGDVTIITTTYNRMVAELRDSDKS
jgi:hypothetical protein